ncbi:hypothetical protein AHMF7605_25705 [Adhaeribacter arboris]|uniref:Uncharacterized protein n=1 Tax=Adhaeribacter arboris TaxID=2072846 RepID=A0A2T2YMD0_9BACT|nr:hypothetical protein [Adhaeribacter arboris]PSR56647.1 hypothetical protein AHMF7605_25705 [Adhaeribacter arboris]
MVSLDALSTYWIPLRANLLTNFFINFLNDIQGLSAPTLNPSDTDNVVCNLLLYVRQNDVTSATALYHRLITRQFRPESEWIHNDYLLFALVCTASKFQLDNNWIRQVLLCRPSLDESQRLTNKTFENLLAGNYNAREDYHQISVVFQIVTQQIQFDETRLNKMFAYLWRNPFPYFESDFLNIVSLRAIRAAFEAKGLLNPEQRFITEQFASRFIARVRLITKIITYTIFALTIGGLAFSAAFFAENIWVKAVLAALSALGLGASFFADIRIWLASRIEKMLKSFWGYK